MRITVQVRFADGTSYAHNYDYARNENEAMASAWHEARLTSKDIWDVSVMAVSPRTTGPNAIYPMIDAEISQ